MDMIEADYWMHHYAENGVTEEFTDDGFDMQAEMARIEAEEEARAAADSVGAAPGGRAGGAAEGSPPPASAETGGDWEELP